MSDGAAVEVSIALGRRLAADLAEFARRRHPDDPPETSPLAPEADLLADFDRRILDEDLRAATRSRFVSKHYADAVEAGVKALNESVRSRTGRTDDGDPLMTAAFSPNAPLLRINPGKTKSHESEQRGHMQLCQGVVGAWRNPRAHTLVDDSPAKALMMLEMIDGLILTTKAATRTRRRKP
ncbi:MAG TPA: TIGR02391 family protein [Acidimicrobiales bacterium]|nr:TIGR02391 family protein [Acidimicrobiales bacterium]